MKMLKLCKNMQSIVDEFISDGYPSEEEAMRAAFTWVAEDPEGLFVDEFREEARVLLNSLNKEEKA